MIARTGQCDPVLCRTNFEERWIDELPQVSRRSRSRSTSSSIASRAFISAQPTWFCKRSE